MVQTRPWLWCFPGIPIRTTLDNSTTVQYAGLLHQLAMKARSTVRDIDPQNDLTFLRVRSKKHEIMVAPGNPLYISNCCLFLLIQKEKDIQSNKKVLFFHLQTKTIFWSWFRTRVNRTEGQTRTSCNAHSLTFSLSIVVQFVSKPKINSVSIKHTLVYFLPFKNTLSNEIKCYLEGKNLVKLFI